MNRKTDMTEEEYQELVRNIEEHSQYQMKPSLPKKWMTVTEMGDLLGLKKTDRYWLVHKNVFESKKIAGKMRVNIGSFEKWYANQVKYRKITGEEPGQELNEWSFSARDIAHLLGITEAVAYDLIKREKIDTVKVVNNRKPNNEYLTAHTVREIHKLLRNAFNQGVKWELMSRNPVLNATLPKEEHKQRDIWTVETLFKALELCDDDMLSLALNLAFSCSLRMGEMLGLTWDCIDISENSIKNGKANIFVNKELQRVNRDALEKLNGKGVVFKFPPALSSTHTALVLKEPKTKTSVRKVFLPKTVAEMLQKRFEEIENLKELFGEEYTDYNLVFASSCGRPIEGQVINRALKKLIDDNDLPPVVFHSFRHSSITYKLKLNGGDMKSVQGDSGHAQVKMVADVYSHIIDDDRRLNAQRFEEQFYQGKGQTSAEKVQAETVPEASQSDKEMLLKLLANPEMAALLKSLAKNL